MEGSVSEGEAVSSEVGNFANSHSSKSTLDFACCSSILALDSACAVRRCCRIAEEKDTVEAVASESSNLVLSVLFHLFLGITKNKTTSIYTIINKNYQM